VAAAKAPLDNVVEGLHRNSHCNTQTNKKDSAAIVAMTAAALERAIRHDWLRVSVAAAALPDMPTWCTLGLARVQLKPEVFQARWLLGDVLADLPEGGGQDALRVHVPRALEEPVAAAGS
jgi:hypothetical protein